DGTWGNWTPFSTCSVSCGGGQKSRLRLCDSPPPVYNGQSCSGHAAESIPCNTQSCQVNGGWGSWSGYSSCSITCDGGTRTRTRLCDNPTPSSGGASCPGSSAEVQPCNTLSCLGNII
ncbi:hypothetical protein LOTGIDRAFT_110577, partial [Lottia gigantea]